MTRRGEKKKKESIVIPPTPMFPKQELGDVLLCYGVHRVRATFDFQGHFQSWLIELPNLPRSLQNIYYTMISVPGFPRDSQNRFELRLNSREIAAHLSPDRWIAADERLRSRQHRSKLGDFRPPCLQSVFRALSFRPDLSFPPFPKWKVIIVVARRSKISSNDESRENDEIITG